MSHRRRQRNVQRWIRYLNGYRQLWDHLDSQGLDRAWNRYAWERNRAAQLAGPVPHEITLVARPEMDAHGLVMAVCSCGCYQSAPNSESGARRAWAAHVDAKAGAN